MPEPLGLTVHGIATPDLSDPREIERSRTLRGRVRMLLVLLVCAAPVVASYVTYFVIRPEGRTNYGTLILPTRSLPALPLRTLDGAAVAAGTLRGQWLLVVVAPAACDAACQDRLSCSASCARCSAVNATASTRSGSSPTTRRWRRRCAPPSRPARR